MGEQKYGARPVFGMCLRPALVLDLQLYACFVCTQALKYQTQWKAMKMLVTKPTQRYHNEWTGNYHAWIQAGLALVLLTPMSPFVWEVKKKKTKLKQNNKKPMRRRYSSEPNEDAKHHKFPCGQPRGR